MSQTIEIKSESIATIVFGIAENGSVIRWKAPNGKLEAIVGGDDDVDIIRDHLLNKELIDKISGRYRPEWDRILTNLKRKEEILEEHLNAQRALLEELKTEFPDRDIAYNFNAREDYSGFSCATTDILVSVTCKNDSRKGWGVYLPNWMSGVYVGTRDKQDPILFTNTGEKILNICKRHTMAWLDEGVRQRIYYAPIEKEIESKEHAIRLYRDELYAKADEKIKMFKDKPLDDVLRVWASSRNIPSEDMRKYKITCDSPPF